MRKRILLADDSVTIQKVVELTFNPDDFEVIVAGDGDQAIQALGQGAPDVVLADVVMPGRTGYEVCQYVKSTPGLQHVPVLLLAGKFEPFDDAHAKEVGADGHIFKPFEGNALVQQVTDLLAGSAAAAPDEAPAPIAESATQPGTMDMEAPFPADPLAPAEPSGAAPTPPEPPADPFAADIADPPAAPVAAADATALDPSPLGSDPIPESPMDSPVDADSADPFGAPAPTSDATVLDPAPLGEASATPDPEATEKDPFGASSGAEAAEGLSAETTATSSEPFGAEPDVMADASAPTAPAPAPAAAAELSSLTAGQGVVDAAAEAGLDLPQSVLDAMVRRVAEQMTDEVVREVVWQVVPELAELMIKRKLDELQ